jgi:hypothetical protein
MVRYVVAGIFLGCAAKIQQRKFSQMNMPVLTSPELTTLNNTKHSLEVRERIIKSDVILLRERLATGDELQPDDRAAQIEHTLAGGLVSATSNLSSQLGIAMLQWRAIDDAKEVLSKNIYKAKRAAAVKIVTNEKPAHDAIMKRLIASLVEVHSAHLELFALRQELCDKEIGLFNGMCELLPDFLGAPTNSYSEFADFMRAAVKANYLKAAPKELRFA